MLRGMPGFHRTVCTGGRTGALELGQLVLQHAPLPEGAIDVVVMGGQVTLSRDQQAAVVQRVLALTQSAGQWSPEVARAMAGFVDALSAQDFRALTPDALVALAGSVAMTTVNDSTVASIVLQVSLVCFIFVTRLTVRISIDP